MNKIVINATANKTSGALTILKDFVNYCVNFFNKELYHFYLFTTVNEFKEDFNFKVFKLNVLNWKERISWDNGGLQKFCQQKGITPDLIISLQNTCTFYPDIPQLVYYHQPLPIVKYNWNPFIKQERILFLYAHFYKYFVNKNNEKATYVVQLPYIKDMFLKKFKNIDINKVFVIRPNNPKISFFQNETKVSSKKRFIYPATSLSYKNHICIIKALSILREKNKNCLNNIEVIFTADDDKLKKIIKKYQLQNVINCIGSIPYKDLLDYYRSSDVLLFPSKIETYGMPLIEAASFGLKIIASDLPYAKEVLEKYNNKFFCNPNSPNEWMQQIEKCITMSLIKTPLELDNINTWSVFFELVSKLINEEKGV